MVDVGGIDIGYFQGQYRAGIPLSDIRSAIIIGLGKDWTPELEAAITGIIPTTPGFVAGYQQAQVTLAPPVTTVPTFQLAAAITPAETGIIEELAKVYETIFPQLKLVEEGYKIGETAKEIYAPTATNGGEGILPGYQGWMTDPTELLGFQSPQAVCYPSMPRGKYFATIPEPIVKQWQTPSAKFAIGASGYWYVTTKYGWKKFRHRAPIVIGNKLTRKNVRKILRTKRVLKKVQREINTVFPVRHRDDEHHKRR